jgi:hypothetical protein
MGLVKRAADLAFTFRFIRMLVLDWKEWDAYKLGLIDQDGKRIRQEKIDTDERKDAYTPFIRLAANVKRLLSKVPGGGSGLGSFAAALYLIKEKYNLKDKDLNAIIEKIGLDPIDLLSEGSQWFVLDDKQLSPGIYKLQESKLINKTCDELVNAKDKIKIDEQSYPVGNVFGIDIYKAKHLNTGQDIYVSVSELIK